MRPADSWRDYELLDATNHNRLERWGQTLLIRPDPQVIWKTTRPARCGPRPTLSITALPRAAGSGIITKSCRRNGRSTGTI